MTDPTEPIELTDAAPNGEEPTERRPTLLLVDGYGLIYRRVSSRGAAE